MWTCPECKPTFRHVQVGATDCPFCYRPMRSSAEMFAGIKKNAKKGSAWGQFELGLVYYDGDLVKQSYSDAFRWFSKASKQNHPQAHMLLGKMLKDGHVAVDLAKAHRHLEIAMSVGAEVVVVEDCRMHLADLAKLYMKVDATVAKSIFDKLVATRGGGASDGAALACRGELYVYDGDYVMASHMYRDAALNEMMRGVDGAAKSMCAFMYAQKVGNLAQAAFWMKRTRVSNIPFSTADARRGSIERLVRFRQDLRALRDICCGCGIEFEGKERKFCRGCRAYCYCSRDCQKMHWNRKDDGHREDCKGLKELKQKVKEAKRMSMLGK